MNDLDTLRQRLRRPAIGFDVGGFRPTGAPTESWFGKVSLCAPGESWPMSNGKPMLALCQLDLRALPFRPPRLDDIDLLCVFVDGDRLPMDTPNGQGWCLRAYRDVDALVPLAPMETGSTIKPFPMRARVLADDLPCHDDLDIPLPDDVADDYADECPNADGLKLGGWPSLIQSEIYWAPFNRHPAAPEYVFQIDSCEKAHWQWGEAGVGYFGRGTAPGAQDEWALAWQCY